MNTPVQRVWDAVDRVIKSGGDDAVFQMIKDETQDNYYALCEKTDWKELRRTKALTFTATETNGQFLPADLIGITSVVSNVTDQQKIFSPIAETQRYFGNGTYRWFYPSIVVTPLDVIAAGGGQNGVDIDQNSATISVTLGGTRTGEYIQLGNLPGVYLLTAAKTISPIYRGDRLKNAPCIVRPATQKKLVLIDTAGALEAEVVQVYYWAYPEPLFQGWQPVMLPTERALVLMTIVSTLRRLNRQHKEADSFQKELEDPATHTGALSDMLALNPKALSPASPRGKTNRIMMMGRRR